MARRKDGILCTLPVPCSPPIILSLQCGLAQTAPYRSHSVPGAGQCPSLCPWKLERASPFAQTHLYLISASFLSLLT